MVKGGIVAGLSCDYCGKTVDDLQGSVMVDRRRFEGPDSSVDHLQVVCKACLEGMDGLAERLHRMWELSWLKQNFVWINQTVVKDLVADEPGTHWAPGAVGEFLRLGIVALPEQAKPPQDA